MKIRSISPADLGAGLLMIIIAAVALFQTKDLQHGTALNMGPGYFPRYVAALLMAIGFAVVWKAFRSQGRGLLVKWKLRPILGIIAAMVFFTLSVRSLGFALAAVGTVASASFATPGQNPLKVVTIAIAMAAFVCLVFIYGLGLPIPIWPGY